MGSDNSECRECGWNGYDYIGNHEAHPPWCLSHSNGKVARIARIVSPTGTRAFDLGHEVAWLRDERRELAHARSLPHGSLWTDEELAQMIASHQKNIRDVQRRILAVAHQIAEVVA